MPGSCLMVGLKGFSLTETEKKFLVSNQIAGVILFKRNIQSFEQVYDLCRELKSLLKPPPLIAVDMEGGEVNRFSHLKPWPSPKELRVLEPNQVSAIAQSMAKQLSLLGIDANFAPVVDLLTTGNPLLEDRVFGDTEEDIINYAGAFLKGFMKEGVIPCLKHFPGHGGVSGDSHKILPKDFRSLKELKPQLDTFQTLFMTYSCWIMTAHIEFPKIEKLPATFSPKLLKEELKGRRAFKGLLVSDDIDMEALNDFSSGEKFFSALRGGCQLVLTCQKEETAKEVIQYFKKNPRKKQEIQKELKESSRYISKIREKRKRQLPDFDFVRSELAGIQTRLV